MFDALDIIRRNAQTYYSFATERRVKRWPTLLLFSLVSTLCAIGTARLSPDFLTGALSAQSILVGFSFNALFYLVTNRLVTPKSWLFIEHEMRFQRLSRLADEIFDNISYFNLIALISIAVNLALLLMISDFTARGFAAFTGYKFNSPNFLYAVTTANIIFRDILTFVLVFTIVEGLSSFSRVIYRVRFYFSMLKTMNDDNAAALNEKNAERDG